MHDCQANHANTQLDKQLYQVLFLIFFYSGWVGGCHRGWVKSSFSIRPMRSVHSHPPTHFIRHTYVQVVNSNEIHSRLSHSQPFDNQRCSLTLMKKVFGSFPTRRLLGSQRESLLRRQFRSSLGVYLEGSPGVRLETAQASAWK